jgi:MFS family permease
MASGVCLTLVGRLGDIFGRRNFFLVGQMFGLAGSLVCGRAKGIPQLIAGSALNGVAGSVQLTFIIVLSELVPNKHRGAVNAGLWFCVFPFTALGPIFARLMTNITEQSWR